MAFDDLEPDPVIWLRLEQQLILKQSVNDVLGLPKKNNEIISKRSDKQDYCKKFSSFWSHNYHN